MSASYPNQIRHSAPAERNRAHILDVLKANLPESGTVLEIASGTGQHISYFAAAMPHLVWQPSDPNPESRDSIRAINSRDALENVAEPLDLDVLGTWPDIPAAAIITANLLHISAPEVLQAFMQGASTLLPSSAYLHVYGPFLQNGAFTSTGNAEFDASLRARNPGWGLRDLDDVVAAASAQGFSQVSIIDMPANNFSLSFRKD